MIANWRIALLVCLSFLSFGVLGFWQDSLDLLIVTGISVAIVILLGMPLAVLVGTSELNHQWHDRPAHSLSADRQRSGAACSK